MRTVDDRVALARAVLEFAKAMREKMGARGASEAFRRVLLMPAGGACAPGPRAGNPARHDPARPAHCRFRARGAQSPPLDGARGSTGMQPLHPDPEIARQLRPYERSRRRKGANRAALPPPVVQARTSKDRYRCQAGRVPASIP